MVNEAARISDLEKENQELRRKLLEKEQAIQYLDECQRQERIRAAAASDVLVNNSAIQKLVSKKIEELDKRQAELEVLSNSLKVAESELSQAQKMESIGRLAAGVAHEINTPIQFVNDSIFFIGEGLTDLFDLIDRLIASGDETAQAQRSSLIQKAIEDLDYDYLRDHTPQALTRASEGIARVSEIIQSMKSFSHPDRTTMTLVDINQGLTSTLAISRNEYKYVAKVVTNLEELPMVCCLGGEINQVFLNLIVNAAHAIEDACRDGGELGTITINSRSDGESVFVDIGDTGIGIPIEIQSKIFDHFFTTKKVGKGTGQGLAIAHKVVNQMHGGDITFKSNPGEGTTFTVRLPIKQTETSVSMAA